MHRRILVFVAVIWLCPRLALAAQQWVAESSSISYRVVHKMHEVVGTSHQVEVVAQIEAGLLQVMARAPVDSFLSGNVNRDAHMLEVVEGHAYPQVQVRAVAKEVTIPAPGNAASISMDVEVTLHGVKTINKIVAHLQRNDATHLSVHVHIADSISGHHIEPPKLFFIAVADVLAIDGTVEMRCSP